MADHKEYWSTESDQGSIRISEDVVASIAALSASETKGVSGLYSSLTSDIVGFISKKNLSKGVRMHHLLVSSPLAFHPFARYIGCLERI